MKKILVLLCLLLIQNTCIAKDIIQFSFPNEGWHKVLSPDKVESKKCYVPYNQTEQNYTEMVILYERILKNTDISAMSILQKQIGKDRNNYTDIIPEYIKQTSDDAIITWCSKVKNTCVVERAFKGNEGIIIAIYLNKMPHYSQNMFGQWSNILNSIKIYNSKEDVQNTNNLIEL